MVWRLRTAAPWRGVAEVPLAGLGDASGVDLDPRRTDRTAVRASRAAAGAASRFGRRKGGEFDDPADPALGLSGGGYGADVHLVRDGNAVPPGVGPPRRAGDKACPGKRVRARPAGRGTEPVVARPTSERVPAWARPGWRSSCDACGCSIRQTETRGRPRLI